MIEWLHASSTYSVLRMDVYAFQHSGRIAQGNSSNAKELEQLNSKNSPKFISLAAVRGVL